MMFNQEIDRHSPDPPDGSEHGCSCHVHLFMNTNVHEHLSLRHHRNTLHFGTIWASESEKNLRPIAKISKISVCNVEKVQRRRRRWRLERIWADIEPNLSWLSVSDLIFASISTWCPNYVIISSVRCMFTLLTEVNMDVHVHVHLFMFMFTKCSWTFFVNKCEHQTLKLPPRADPATRQQPEL